MGVKKEDGINFVCERFVPLLLPCEEKTTEKAELLFQVLYQWLSSEITSSSDYMSTEIKKKKKHLYNG